MASNSRPVGVYFTEHDIQLMSDDMAASGVSNRSRYISLLVNLAASVGGIKELEKKKKAKAL